MANFDFYSDLTRWIAEIAGDSQAPWVHSVSYGSQGNYPTKSYQDRFDVELQKVGLRGISIIFASGDSGAGTGALCHFLLIWDLS
jgi:tripeptidyl-peptidase-1